MENERRIANSYGIYSLWFNWAISIGLLVAVPIFSLYISKLWIPIIAIFFEVVLYSMMRYSSNIYLPTCFRLHYISMIILLWSSLIMCVINLVLNQKIFKIPFLTDNVNEEVPYISVLIISTVAVCVIVLNLKSKYNSLICKNCKAIHGSTAERGFLGKLFSQEGLFLTQISLMIFVVISIISWVYYFIFYINTNINDLDRFVFVWSLVILYGLSLIYLGIRYFSLWLYYRQNIEGQSLRYNSSSYVRYIIICGDYIYLKTPDIIKDNVMADEDKVDIPARLFIKYKKSIRTQDAVDYFNSLSGIANAELRFLYENTNFNTECNIFHYAYFVDNFETINNSRLEGKWYTLSEIKYFILNNKVSEIFSSEMNRVFKIVSAWKTYDINGNRRYNIRHYQPTFRLCDMKDWDIDYNDIRWLLVAENNADKRFFYFRKFWTNYIIGIIR